MFGFNIKKSSGKLPVKTEAEPKVYADLIVHNMPPANRLSGGLALSPQRLKKNASFSQKSLSTVAPRHNFKLVGILIIAGGLVFIGLLFYLSYRYIIMPAAKSPSASESIVNVPTSSAPIAQNASGSPIGIVPVVLNDATTTALATSVVTVLDLATSSASSTLGGATTEPAPLLDSDNDGLNDEEEAAFGSNPNLADTNNNAYNDLTEILNNYNPIGSGRLNAAASLTTFVSQVLGYSVLAPKDWPAKSLNNDNTVLFNAPDDSLIQISLQDNTNKQSILSWYSDFFPTDAVTYDRLKSQETWDGVMAADGFNFYLTDKKHKSIYIISYIPAVDDRVVYPNVFKMMINSLILK